jgi:hypothetical protein
LGCCSDTDLGNLWEVPMEGSHKLFTELGRQPCVQPLNLEDRFLCVYTPGEGSQLFPQVLGSLLVDYDFQGYSGGIVTHIHVRYFKLTGNRLVEENAIASN